MKLNPGQTAPKTASYRVVDENGKVVNTVQVKKGNRMPPTQSSGNHFELDE